MGFIVTNEVKQSVFLEMPIIYLVIAL